METYATMSVDVQGNHLAGAPWRKYRADNPAEAAMLRTRTTTDTHYVSTVAMPNGRTLVVLAPIGTGTVERVIVMVADPMSAEARTFFDQNATAAQSLTVDQVEAFADHHAGGLVVLWRSLSDDWSVKMHDSWGGPDDDGNDVIVHVYRNSDEDPRDTVTYYATGREAYAAFMAAEAPDHAPVTLSGPVGQREEDIVHDVILDGLADRSEGSAGETPVVLDLVDFSDPATADQAGVKPGAYVREANDYGQRVTYRFATREAADRYMDEISSDF